MSSMLGNTGMRGPTGSATGLKGTGYQAASLQQFTPEQMQLFSQMFSQVGPQSYLGKLAGGDESMFQQMEAPALRQFGQLQGNIASRFSAGGGGPGAMSSRRSGGFQNVMSGAGAELAERLAGNRQSLQQQAIRDLMGLSGQLLQQRPYENFLVPEKKPFWQELLMGLAPGVGQAASTAGSMWGMGKLGILGG